MSLVYFSFGIIVGILSIQIYVKFVKVKGKKVDNEETIFQLVESSKDILYHYEVKPSSQFIYISPAIEKFLGKGIIEDSFKNSQLPFERIHPDDYENYCNKIYGKMDYSQPIIQRWKDDKGNYRWFEEFATPIYNNGEVVAVQGIIRNIDDKVKLQQDLEYQIYHDSLTDTFNRKYFELLFTKYNEQINAPVAIILCDIDELKYTNDNFGHKMGDVLIQETAKILNKFASDDITVARIGGDEFVLIVADTTESQIKKLITDIEKEIDNNNPNDFKVNMKMSVGYSYATYSIGQMAELFSQADKNMYIDKMQRKKLLMALS